jgi:hypothetical protein
MMADTQPTNQSEQAEKGKLTPELVRRVADKVYALWQRDMTVERERKRYAKQ